MGEFRPLEPAPPGAVPQKVGRVIPMLSHFKSSKTNWLGSEEGA
jgi:hypothetical protein